MTYQKPELAAWDGTATEHVLCNSSYTDGSVGDFTDGWNDEDDWV